MKRTLQILAKIFAVVTILYGTLVGALLLFFIVAEGPSAPYPMWVDFFPSVTALFLGFAILAHRDRVRGRVALAGLFLCVGFYFVLGSIGFMSVRNLGDAVKRAERVHFQSYLLSVDRYLTEFEKEFVSSEFNGLSPTIDFYGTLFQWVLGRPILATVGHGTFTIYEGNERRRVFFRNDQVLATQGVVIRIDEGRISAVTRRLADGDRP